MYIFGHHMVAALTQLTGISSSITFNLGVALVAALAAVGVFGLVYNLLVVRARPSVAAICLPSRCSPAMPTVFPMNSFPRLKMP
jgi:uncharacterized membrane protein